MVNIIILDKLRKATLQDNEELLQLISMRKLSQREIALARKKGIRRYYLPCLDQNEVQEFYDEFDKFWNRVIHLFSKDHFFWRNAISSKMQEWERSLSYFILILFTLFYDSHKRKDLNLIFICSSLQEEDALAAWAGKFAWSVTHNRRSNLRWFRMLIQQTKNNFRATRFLAACFYRKLMAPKTRVIVSDNNHNPIVLIVSLFYSHSFLEGKYTDPFFGTFHKYLEKKGIRYIYLCDSLNRPNFRLKQNIHQCRDPKVIMPYSLLSIRKLSSILLRVFFRKFHFVNCEFMGVDFSKVILWNARRSSDYWNINAEVFFEATKKLCRKISLSQLLYIYEGSVFERACVQAFRQSSTGRILGYSHGNLDQLNLKLRLTDGEALIRPEPDRYVCAGSYTRKRLAEIGNIDLDKISTGCSLRGIPPLSHLQDRLNTAKQILIGLDGMWSSVNMLDWLFEHALIFKDFKVRIRPHPNVPFKKLKEQCLHTIPEYFEVSSDNLREDLKRSFCVIYRQSSIGIQALLNGIPAIHLAIDLPLPGDSMEELSVGKWVVKTPQELKAAFESIKSLDQQVRYDLLKEAKNFAEGYFSEPTEDKLQDFLEVNTIN